MITKKSNELSRFKKIIAGIKEKTNEPMLPDIVLFGLILVNFFPPIVLPITYPPVSEKIQINKVKISKYGGEL